MALNRVDYPANLTDQADFSAHGTLIETGYLDKSFAPLLVLGGEIPQGIVLQIGGVVYRADSAETVTGTASKYVRVAPSGATATASYVANLSGVSWNAQYNGYYDGSGNLYIFDENQALYDGAVATVKTRFVQQAEDGDVYVGRDLKVKRNTAGESFNASNGYTADGTISFSRGNFSALASGTNSPGYTKQRGNGRIFRDVALSNDSMAIEAGAPSGGSDFRPFITLERTASDVNNITLKDSVTIDGTLRLDRLIPRTTIAFTNNTTTIVPKGTYFIRITIGSGSGTARLEVKDFLGNWITIMNETQSGAIKGMMVFSDGENVRVVLDGPFGIASASAIVIG